MIAPDTAPKLALEAFVDVLWIKAHHAGWPGSAERIDHVDGLFEGSPSEYFEGPTQQFAPWSSNPAIAVGAIWRWCELRRFRVGAERVPTSPIARSTVESGLCHEADVNIRHVEVADRLA
jgi:hypothetical protein